MPAELERVDIEWLDAPNGHPVYRATAVEDVTKDDAPNQASQSARSAPHSTPIFGRLRRSLRKAVGA